jgi:hypothetical protein
MKLPLSFIAFILVTFFSCSENEVDSPREQSDVNSEKRPSASGWQTDHKYWYLYQKEGTKSIYFAWSDEGSLWHGEEPVMTRLLNPSLVGGLGAVGAPSVLYYDGRFRMVLTSPAFISKLKILVHQTILGRSSALMTLSCLKLL